MSNDLAATDTIACLKPVVWKQPVMHDKSS